MWAQRAGILKTEVVSSAYLPEVESINNYGYVKNREFSFATLLQISQSGLRDEYSRFSTAIEPSVDSNLALERDRRFRCRI